MNMEIQLDIVRGILVFLYVGFSGVFAPMLLPFLLNLSSGKSFPDVWIYSRRLIYQSK